MTLVVTDCPESITLVTEDPVNALRQSRCAYVVRAKRPRGLSHMGLICVADRPVFSIAIDLTGLTSAATDLDPSLFPRGKSVWFNVVSIKGGNFK